MMVPNFLLRGRKLFQAVNGYGDLIRTNCVRLCTSIWFQIDEYDTTSCTLEIIAIDNYLIFFFFFSLRTEYWEMQQNFARYNLYDGHSDTTDVLTSYLLLREGKSEKLRSISTSIILFKRKIVFRKRKGKIRKDIGKLTNMVEHPHNSNVSSFELNLLF